MAVTFFFAFVAGLALIGVAAWLVRRFASNRLSANSNRGRMPRLAVIDAAAVDGRRRLVLVRRDNMEHLLLIGGPTDIVVESNIVRAVPARDQRPGLPGATASEPPRVTPLPGMARSETEAQRAEAFDHREPQMPEPPPRPLRPSFAEELRRPAPVAPERRGEPLPGLAAESLSLRAEPRLEPRPEAMPPRMPSRAEPAMPRLSRWSETPKPPVRAPERAAAPPPPPPPQSADANLAEMAQRLEAALRGPAAAPGTDAAPPVAPEAPPRDRAAPPQSEQPEAPPVPPPSPKSSFENLEDEMASLLGRSKSS
jgi:flagellar biogenesis protein FliO